MTEKNLSHITKTVSAADFEYLKGVDLQQIDKLYQGDFVLKIVSLILFNAAAFAFRSNIALIMFLLYSVVMFCAKGMLLKFIIKSRLILWGVILCAALSDCISIDKIFEETQLFFVSMIIIITGLGLLAFSQNIKGFFMKFIAVLGWICYGMMLFPFCMDFSGGIKINDLPRLILSLVSVAISGFGLWFFSRAVADAFQYPQWLLRHFRNRKKLEQELETFSVDDSDRQPPLFSLSEDQRRWTAVHEAGHAVCAHFLPGIPDVESITVSPQHESFGQILFKEKITPGYQDTESQLLNLMAVYYGGFLAEKLIFGEKSIGSEADLKCAFNVASNMVNYFGMGKRIGLINAENYCHPDWYADVRDISLQAEKICTELLTENKEYVAALAELLLEMETLESFEIDKFFAKYKCQTSSCVDAKCPDGSAILNSRV